MPTSPTTTMRARSRAKAAASSTGSFELVAAVIRIASQSSADVGRSASVSSDRTLAHWTPAWRARSTSSGPRSTPTTSHPAASNGRHASWPTSPSPITAIRSPIDVSAWRTACSAMLPTVANAPASKETVSGSLAHKLAGTRLSSAWTAWPAPAHATRSPGRRSLTRAPAATITPALEYPTGDGWPRRVRTVSRVARSPSRCALSSTWRA